jgi:hypothetical protein
MLKKSKPLEQKRTALTSNQVEQWFDRISKIIRENDLENRPAQILNCNESGKILIVFFSTSLSLNDGSRLADGISYSKTIVRRGTSNAYRTQGGTGGKSIINVMFCASATGIFLPLFIVYKSKQLLQE